MVPAKRRRTRKVTEVAEPPAAYRVPRGELPAADAPGSWVPDRGDVIWLDFDPQTGREQAGRRPAVVLSPASYNAPTSRALCVPVSTKAKGYPFEVPMPEGFPVQGVAFADQVKCLDWRARHASLIGELPTAVLTSLLVRTRALLE